MPAELWTFKAADNKWHHPDGRTIDAGTAPPPPPPGPLFAGHLPFQVQIGMNAPEDTGNPTAPPRPQYTEAVALLGGDVGTVRRVYDFGNWISNSVLNGMVAEADADGVMPIGSLKVPGERWDQVIAGAFDADLTTLRNWAIARRTAGKGPVLMTIHHEPNNNGPWSASRPPTNGGTDYNLENMRTWGKMELYALNFMTGWASRGISNTGGTYNAAEDVRDIMPWHCIANGFWWGTKFPHDDLIAAAYTPTLIAAFNDRGGPLAADVYDPTNATYQRDANGDRIESSITFASNYDSCWREIQKMCAWARANNVKVIGFGEMGNVLTANYNNTIDQLMANRDIIAFACIFNNMAASKWDWVHKPADYPAYNGTNSNGLTDFGGDQLSQNYIDRFKVLLARSYAETAPF